MIYFFVKLFLDSSLQFLPLRYLLFVLSNHAAVSATCVAKKSTFPKHNSLPLLVHPSELSRPLVLVAELSSLQSILLKLNRLLMAERELPCSRNWCLVQQNAWLSCILFTLEFTRLTSLLLPARCLRSHMMRELVFRPDRKCGNWKTKWLRWPMITTVHFGLVWLRTQPTSLVLELCANMV